jgi:hypothetical protein
MKKYYILLLLIISLIVFMFVFVKSNNLDDNTNISIVKNDPISNKLRKMIESVWYPTQQRYAGMFNRVVLITQQPLAELIALVGDSKVDVILRINRIDRDNLKSGMTIIIPKNIDDIKQWQYMPNRINTANSIPKLIIVSQPIQAFGVYENGFLVYSGLISSGKELSQTPGGLFFVNWKGEEVISTFDDEWILKWNMNIDNLAGISMHQYSLPGYPASHSCIRMTEADAYWLYNWTDEWIWHNGEITTEGTPVIVYSKYDFNNPPPWTLLPENSKSTDTPRSILENLVKGYQSDIKSGALK